MRIFHEDKNYLEPPDSVLKSALNIAWPNRKLTFNKIGRSQATLKIINQLFLVEKSHILNLEIAHI